MQPDYSGGGLVNLVASIVEACGGRALHPCLKDFSLGEPRNVVLFVVDGLGDNYLRRRGGELAARRRRAITSVFPSTTASAITTTYTGCTPLEHGLTGWFTYFGAAGCVAAALPFRSRGDMLPLGARGVRPEDIYVRRSIFEQVPLRSIVVTARDIVDSQYNSRHCRGAERLAYESLDELVSHVERSIKGGDERKFVYAYWPAYDQVSHRYGCESREAALEHEKIDAAFAELLRRLRGTETELVVTADHGFVDVSPEESLELPGFLLRELRFPLCGERRIAYCHVHAPGEFAKKASEWLGSRADVFPSKQLVEEGWFGPGTPHERFAERIGDVALVMRGRYTVKDWVAGEPRHLHVGNHGGPSEDEMLIPLVTEEL
jgi:Type I phosphodiesterase / nucleotide pyrophosphatase